MSDSATPNVQRPPSVLILVNRPEDVAPIHNLDDEHLQTLRAALKWAGYKSAIVNLEDDIDRLDAAVEVHRPTLIYHLVDHIFSDTLHQGSIAGMLELFGYVYTGSDAAALSNCQERARAHVLLQNAGLPVTPFVVVRDVNVIPDTEGMAFPQIVSQAYDDIYDDDESRECMHSRAEVVAHCKELALEFDLPFVIETLLPGKRIQACVLGNKVLEVLPLVETRRDEDGSVSEIAQLDAELAGRIRQLAQRAFRCMGLRDVGQIDFALDHDDWPYIVDVRPSVDFFGPVFCCAAAQREGGLEFALAEVLRNCHRRLPPAELHQHPLPLQRT